jgi:hypothetical protein
MVVGDRLGALKPLHGPIDVARRDGEANLPSLDLHGAQLVGCSQRLDRGQLHVVGFGALPRCAILAELLIDQHAGDQEHADGRPSGKLGADGQIQKRHGPAPAAIAP